MKAVLRNVVMLLTAGSLALVAAPASSADTITCDGAIVDQTNGHVLTSKDSSAQNIQSALDGVASYGADVYVRAFQSTPGGNADAFWKQGLAQCSNWSAPDGHPKANVIVVVLGMDHKSGIFFNSAHYPVLQSRFDTIMAQDMNANFKGSNFVDGIVSGLNSIKAAIQPGATANAPTSSGPSGAAIMKVVGAIFGGIIVIALLVGAFFGIRRLSESRRERREAEAERLDWQAKARTAKSNASSELLNARSDEDLKREFLMATAGLPTVMTNKHRRIFEAIDASSDEQIDVFATLNNDPAYDPEGTFTKARYVDQQKRYNTVAETLKSIANQYKALFATIEEDKRDLTPEARTLRWNNIKDGVARQQAVLDECSRVFNIAPQQQRLAELRQQVQAAQTFLVSVDEQQIVTSFDQLEDLERKLGELSSQFEKLATDRDLVKGARQSFQNKVASRRRKLESLKHVSSSSSLADLEQIEQRIDERVDTLKSIRSRDELLKAIEKFTSQIQKVGHKDVAEDDQMEAKAEAERRRKREAEEAERRRRREREEEEERSRRRRNDSFTGGFVGGAIGSSWGSSSSSSFGGGGSSWGGGSDSGGGGSSW